MRQTKIEEKDKPIGQDDEVVEVFCSNLWHRPILEHVSMLAKSTVPFAPNIGLNQGAKLIQTSCVEYSWGRELSRGPKVNRKMKRMRGRIGSCTTRTKGNIQNAITVVVDRVVQGR